MSVAAFHKHHSWNENSFSRFTSFERFRSVSFCTSAHVFSGTKNNTEHSTSSFRPVMRV